LIWHPDTCECVIEFNKDKNWIQTYKKCRLHGKLKGQLLIDTVLAQNRRFNLAFGNIELNQREITIIWNAKGQNIERIRREDLTNFVEDLPHENFIRRILRV